MMRSGRGDSRMMTTMMMMIDETETHNNRRRRKTRSIFNNNKRLLHRHRCLLSSSSFVTVVVSSCAAFVGVAMAQSASSTTMPEDNIVVVPDEWVCDPAYYGPYPGANPAPFQEPLVSIDQICDCGCGAVDPTCSISLAPLRQHCGVGSCNATHPECTKPDPDWICPSQWYFDADCDCGCNATDPACVDPDPTVVNYQHCLSEFPCSPNEITCPDPENLIPKDWSCPAVFLEDDYCDCGCGTETIDPVQRNATES